MKNKKQKEWKCKITPSLFGDIFEKIDRDYDVEDNNEKRK